MKSASVIVPARDAGGSIGKTVSALLSQQTNLTTEIVLVVDRDDEETAGAARRAGGENVKIVEAGPASGGRPAAMGLKRNLGVAASRGEALAFTDADCVPEPDWLEKGVAALAAADLVQGLVRTPPGEQVGPFDRVLTVGRDSGLYETANLFVRRELFERVGGFQDWLQAAGKPLAEDTWFGWRARRAGAGTAFCATAVVNHAVWPRDAAGFIAERSRRRYFPAMARRMPELRGSFFWRRFFLDSRTAAFDAALAALIVGACSDRRWPLLAAAPYAAILVRELSPPTPGAAKVVAARAAADAVSFGALLSGSVESRCVVI